MQLQLTLVFVIVLSKWRTFGEVVQDEDGKGGKISFKPPTLNDEYHHSLHMPEDLKCDACNIVAFQITRVLTVAHAKQKSVKRLPDSDMYELVEDACSHKNYEHYGVKEVGKVTRLSGPGLETKDAPGIMQGGGKWPDRLNRMCNLYIEEFEEEVIYDVYLMDTSSLPEFFCKNPTRAGLTDVCLPRNETAAKTTKKKKKVKEDL